MGMGMIISVPSCQAIYRVSPCIIEGDETINMIFLTVPTTFVFPIMSTLRDTCVTDRLEIDVNILFNVALEYPSSAEVVRVFFIAYMF